MFSKGRGWYRRWGKRVFDLCLAIPGLIIVSPLLLVLGGAVRVFLGTPILFVQERPGYCGRRFTLIKFRTMIDARDVSGDLLPDSQRLTAFGRFLRRSSLDELPELFNVIKGEMSLVGPRPLLLRYYPYFTEAERARFEVRPGITGLAQVQGRNDLSWDSRIAWDVDYVARCSFGLDLEILLRTLWCVFRREGLREDPGAAMLDFDEERRRAGFAPGQEGS